MSGNKEVPKLTYFFSAVRVGRLGSLLYQTFSMNSV